MKTQLLLNKLRIAEAIQEESGYTETDDPVKNMSLEILAYTNELEKREDLYKFL